MPRSTSFQRRGLHSDVKDTNETIISDWYEQVKNDVYEACCRVCCKVFSIANMGLASIMSHAEGKKHLENMKLHKDRHSFW